MTSTPEAMVQQVPPEFQHLLTYVTGPAARWQTASRVELTVCRRLLVLGAVLWRLFCVTRAAVRPAEPVTAPEGTHLPYHEQRPTTDDSGVGKGRFARPFLPTPGAQGLGPLDAALSLPARCDADRRREWVVDGTTDASYRERPTGRDRLLGRSRSVQALETGVPEAGEDVPPCDAQSAAPTAAVPAGTILGVQAEGTGGPMVQPPPAAAWASGQGAATRPAEGGRRHRP